MSDKPKQYAVCIRNEEHEESLELRKIYEVIEDPTAENQRWFMAIELPHAIEEAISELSHS